MDYSGSVLTNISISELTIEVLDAIWNDEYNCVRLKLKFSLNKLSFIFYTWIKNTDFLIPFLTDWDDLWSLITEWNFFNTK